MARSRSSFLLCLLLISLLLVVSPSLATSDGPFIVAHKKVSLARQKSGMERVSVSVDIYNQGSENPSTLDAGIQDGLIDLHGLHVNEAIQVLQHELSILRSTARSSGQRLQAMICVGTGHHTKGARTPARLPVAVEQFLLEEGLHFTQPQPGLLRVVIY